MTRLKKRLLLGVQCIAAGVVSTGIAGLIAYPIPRPWSVPALLAATAVLGAVISTLIPDGDERGPEA